MSTLDFNAMGTSVRLEIAGVPRLRAEALLAAGRKFIDGFDAALSRFRPESELTRMNQDPAATVEVSWLMSELIDAALWAAQASGGLVDPTLTPALERAGYARSRVGAEPVDLTSALADAPERCAAAADPSGRWREIEFDRGARLLTRPPGLTLDSGGSGKGLAADLLARTWAVSLGPRAHFTIDCGGDIRFGPRGNRWGRVRVEDPFAGEALELACRGGAVATSSIRSRIWRDAQGAPAHHLIDPAAGTPAWTGVVAVTALAPTALVAETLSKVAFLRGPAGARETLIAADGGLIVFDDGTTEVIESGLLAAA